MKMMRVVGIAGLFVLACGEESDSTGNQRDQLSDLVGADAVWVADLDGGEDRSIDELIESGVFERADGSDAEAIALLLGTEDNYMETANACFDNDVAIRFRFADNQRLHAIVGLTCWNVNFVGEEDDQVVPADGYLSPGSLEELAVVLKRVSPSLDITAIGE